MCLKGGEWEGQRNGRQDQPFLMAALLEQLESVLTARSGLNVSQVIAQQSTNIFAKHPGHS